MAPRRKPAVGREAFYRNHGVYPLRQWTYPPVKTYNGFSSDERIRGWQVERWFVDNGWLDRPVRCSITGATKNVGFHDEDYYTPWEPIQIGRGVHMALHQRFSRPAWWNRILRENTVTGDEWFCSLSTDADIDLAGRYRAMHGDDIQDVLGRAPVPDNIPIPWPEIRAMIHPLTSS